MNDFLEFTGHLLYFSLCILLMPLFLLLQLILKLFTSAKYVKARYRRFNLILRSGKPYFKLPRLTDLLHRIN